MLPDAAPGVADAGGGSPVDASGGTPDATPVGTPCDPIAQNCGPGQKCALIVTDVAAQTGFTGCYPNGDKGLAQACATPSVADTADDCIAGAHCVFGTCHAICKLGSNPCADGQCIGINNLEMQFDVCLPSCDPLAPACSPGEGCYLTGMDQGVCAPPVGGGQPPGGPCTAPNDCAPGSGCFNDPGQCLSYCDYATYPGERDPARCASGEVCGPITGETRVGACR
ncbi:MAG: hypothetical protein D6689_00845 [Deltaproteobacteria bacterium]|nr:MAG: hypothetical protein D6689_00845 [Deltaproteobacteria bacterium]